MITVTDADTLRQRVWELAETDPNPFAVAATLRAELTSIDNLRLIADLAFAAWVKKIMTQASPPEKKAEPEITLYDDGLGGKTPNPNKAAARTWWESRILRKVQVENVYFHLGDCNRDQVLWLAEFRRKKAAEDLAAATKYEKLAQAMQDGKAATVADVDPEIGESILR